MPFAAGGTTDIVARLIAEKLQISLDVPVIVDNKPGASGNIGAAAVAQSAPDGYTLMLSTPGPTVANSYFLDEPANYDPKTAFAPVATLATLPNVLMVRPSLGVDTVAQFVQKLKAEPGKFTHGSPGVGSSGYVTTVLFNARADINAVHVPYRGSLPMLQDIVAGNTDYTIDQVTSALSLIQSGHLKALAVSSPERSAVLPDVPTIAEAGYPGFKVVVWFALHAPAGVPPQIIERLNKDVNVILKDQAIRDRLKQYGAMAPGGTPEDLAGLVALEQTNVQAVKKQLAEAKSK